MHSQVTTTAYVKETWIFFKWKICTFHVRCSDCPVFNLCTLVVYSRGVWMSDLQSLNFLSNTRLFKLYSFQPFLETSLSTSCFISSLYSSCILFSPTTRITKGFDQDSQLLQSSGAIGWLLLVLKMSRFQMSCGSKYSVRLCLLGTRYIITTRLSDWFLSASNSSGWWWCVPFHVTGSANALPLITDEVLIRDSSSPSSISFCSECLLDTMSNVEATAAASGIIQPWLNSPFFWTWATGML